MLIKIIKSKLSIYEKLNNVMYNDRIKKEIIYNGVIIRYMNINWIVSRLDCFGGFLSDNLDFNVELLAKKKSFKVKNIKTVSFYEKDFQEMKQPELKNFDCYYDTYLNLVLIKVPNSITFVDAINFENLFLNEDTLIDDYKEDLEIIYPNEEYKLESKKLKNIGKYLLDYEWEKKYLVGPPRLLLKIILVDDKMNNKISINQNLSNGILYSFNKFVGFVENINENEIIFLSLTSIKKVFSHLKKCIGIYVYDEIKTFTIDEVNKSYGILFLNNLINNEKTIDSKGNIKTIQYKVLDKETIIKSIDGHNFNEKGYLINDKNKKMEFKIIKYVPLLSYLWYLKENNENNELFLDVEIIKKNNIISIENFILKLVQVKNLEIEKKELLLVKNMDYYLLKNYFNYIYYKDHNIYLIELNNIFLSMIQAYLLKNKCYENTIQYINEKKYDKNPILLAFKIKDECPLSHFKVKIEIVKNYRDILDIETKLKKISNIKNFLISIFE